MIRITYLVDNAADRGSALWAEHGLVVLIETPDGTLLGDTGQSGTGRPFPAGAVLALDKDAS